MDPAAQLRLALDPSEILRAQGMAPDPWQQQFLLAEDRCIMLCCSRGAGKSRTTSAKALHRALVHPASLILLLSRAQRQSLELFRYVKEGYNALGRPIRATKWTETQLELENRSRIVCLPGKEDSIRSFQGVALLIKDEAARIPEDVNKAVTPMIAVSGGQEIDLSTPFGQRGWFYKKWTDADRPDIRRFKVTWRECPRHSPAFIDRERHEHGDGWVQQEYECSFIALSGLVYPAFAQALWDIYPVPIAAPRKVGGIDFGFRNPFAAVWGYLEGQDLFITNERYKRECPLHVHMQNLPKDVEWWADPNHPTEIYEMRRAGFVVKKANNNIPAGIAAVRSRLDTGRLKVWAQGCPNLISESELHHYPTKEEQQQGARAEIPIDADNHALGALRYLISKIDTGFIARWLKEQGAPEGDDIDPTLTVRDPDETLAALTSAQPHPAAETPANRLRRLLNDPDAWTIINN